MRILQIIQKKQFRGAEIFCCQLSNHLIRMGHEVEVCSVFDGESDLPFHKAVKSLNGNQNIRYLDYKGWRNLNEVISTYKPDLVQANAADTLKYAVFSKKIFGWKQPILYRNASISSFYINDAFTKKINSFLLESVDGIISVSRFSKDDLSYLFPVTEHKTEVIPIGIEEDETDTAPMEIHEFKSNRINLVHVGSLTQEKNHFGLLEIFQIILEDCQDAHLHIIGEGPLKSAISKKIGELGLEHNISLHGEMKDPFRYIAQADVLLLPSLIEGLPAVILEAMYCKTPVVAYNVGGISEIMNKHTGYLIEKGEQEAFKNAVLEILAARPEEKIENAYKMVKAEYMNEKIALKFEEVYRRLLE